MHYTKSTRLLSMILAIVMVVGLLPMSVFATENDNAVVAADADNFKSPKIAYTEREDGYYNLISKTDYVLAPGISESEIVLNNDAGSHRQVAHVVEVDINNPYAKVIPGTYKMAEGLENKDYKVQVMSEQAAYAEANGYGNVVAAMNIALSWYDSAYYTDHPELIGEPLGYLVLDGELYKNSQGQSSGAQTVLVINFDEKDGTARPASMSKTEIRSTKDPITGWEEQVIPANFGFLVKDGKNQYSKNHTTDAASRSFMGIKADGSIIIVMNDGRQSPYSAGFNSYEMAEFMLSLGCVYAVNGDGGGSSAFLSQRPGEDLKVNCKPSDGAERPTTHGILVISNAPATGEFTRATISTAADYYTPGSSVQFNAVGSDLVGTAAEIPADAIWQLADTSFGTIDNNGLFVSNGKEGEVVVQMVYNGEVVGEDTINVVIPDSLSFVQTNVTAPYSKTVTLELVAKLGHYEVVLKDGDVLYALSDAAMGELNGNVFTATSDESITEGIVTATLTHNELIAATASINFGKASEIVYDFEEGAASIANISLGYKSGYPASTGNWYDEIGVVTAENGKVKNGNYAMKIVSNSNSTQTFSWQQTQYNGWDIDLTDAVSISFWMYIPEGSHGAEWDIGSAIPIKMGHEFVYGTGWQYFTVPVSSIGSNVTNLNQIRLYRSDNNETATNYNAAEHPNYYSDIIYYVDDITVNYSSAVDDNHAPIISNVLLAHDSTDVGIAMNGQTICESKVSVTASIADDTSYGSATGLDTSSVAVYVDGMNLGATCTADGFVSTGNVILANGAHVFRIEAADKNGNAAYVEKTIVINKDDNAENTVVYAPKNAGLSNLPAKSLYWMDLAATAIEKVQTLEMLVDLDLNSDWELDHMVLAEGFSATYTIDSETNDAAIIITRTGAVSDTGETVIAQLPIRVWSPTFANDKDHRTHRLVAVESYVEKGLLTETDGNEVPFGSQKYSAVTEFNDTRTNGKDRLANWHEHTTESLEDQAPTCTEIGYTGRTYCEVCDSVVEWGTAMPATGHTYEAIEGKWACQCGEESDVTGLVTDGEKSYYAIKGELFGGWQMIGEDWYYFDKTTFEGLEGEQTADSTVKFVFEKGRVTANVWETTDAGIRCWYGPKYYRDSSNDPTSCWPYEIDGKTYLFNRQGYMQTGVVHFFSAAKRVYYRCAEDGVAVLLNGPYEDYFYQDGVRQNAYQLVDFEGKYYFISDYNKLMKNGTVYLSEKFVEGHTYPNGDPMQVGRYEFNGNGEMVILNGPIDDYFYVNGIRQSAYKLVEFDGEHYFVNDYNKLLKNGTVYLGEKFVEGHSYPNGDPMQPGRYEFDADGKMIIVNGPIGDYFYVNGIIEKAYKLVEFEGKHYFINDANKLLKNASVYLSQKFVEGHTYPNGDPMQPGRYEFNADGQMILVNGPVGDYFYVNGIIEKAYKLVEYEGNHYFINDGNKLMKNGSLYLSEKFVDGHTYANGDSVLAGRYEFDANGRMIVLNGPEGDYFYINGVLQKAYQLVEFDGNIYFISDYNKLTKNKTVYLSKTFTEAVDLPAGKYTFDTDGKMIRG